MEVATGDNISDQCWQKMAATTGATMAADTAAGMGAATEQGQKMAAATGAAMAAETVADKTKVFY